MTEKTSLEIQKKLAKHGLIVHAATIRWSCKEQGWTRQQTRYANWSGKPTKLRLEFAQRVLDSGDTFDNVIFSNECSISFQQFRRTCYRKVDEPVKRKPKPKHPLKVHVWAGISRSGATKICIFEGIMQADLYCNIILRTPWFLSSMRLCQTIILCRTMTPNTRRDVPRPFSTSMASTGGGPLLKAQT